MKKFLSILLIGCIVMCVPGCGKKKEDTPDQGAILDESSDLPADETAEDVQSEGQDMANPMESGAADSAELPTLSEIFYEDAYSMNMDMGGVMQVYGEFDGDDYYVMDLTSPNYKTVMVKIGQMGYMQVSGEEVNGTYKFDSEEHEEDMPSKSEDVTADNFSGIELVEETDSEWIFTAAGSEEYADATITVSKATRKLSKMTATQDGNEIVVTMAPLDIHTYTDESFSDATDLPEGEEGSEIMMNAFFGPLFDTLSSTEIDWSTEDESVDTSVPQEEPDIVETFGTK